MVTLIGVGLVVCVQIYYSNKLAVSAANTLFTRISQDVNMRMTDFDDNIRHTIEFLEDFPGIISKPDLGTVHPSEKIISKIVKNNKQIYSAYIGQADGSFFQVINLSLDEKLRKELEAPENSRWAVVKILRNSGEKHTEFIDDDLKHVSGYTEQSVYKPYERPWFTSAMLSENIVKTEPYTFANLSSAGISYAKKISESSNAVIGIDIYLNTLTEFMDSIRMHDTTDIAIMDDQDTVVTATSGYSRSLLNKVINSKYKQNAIFSISDGLKKYLVILKPFSNELAENQKIYVAVPMSVMRGPFDDILTISFYVSIALSVIIIPLILMSSKILEKPLRMLMEENKLISQRRFHEVKPVRTMIKEYQDLSASMVRMAGDIESFQLSQQHLFDSFVKLLAQAIDDKSAYTGGHCERVPILCEMISMAASESDDGEFKDFRIENMDQWREIQISAWLHDCGKLVIPEYVVDKATRLETIYNRIHEVRTRFEVVWRDIELEAYKKMGEGTDPESVQKWLKEQHEQLIEDFNFIAEKNDGDNFVSDEDVERIKKIASREWVRHFDSTIGLSYEEAQRTAQPESNIEKLIADKAEHIIERPEKERALFENNEYNMKVPEHLYNLGEVYNLSIPKGTLTAEERFKINEHIIMSIKMLEQVPFPEHMANVPEYACNHHEAVSGKGYPRGLIKEEMSLPSRIMAVADVFEALTAADRPYKKAKTLSEAVKILSFMVKDGHLDGEVFKLFIKSGVYKEYAEYHLAPEQIDEVNESDYV
jgi:HD-GYP domain-containing protein (c-di-GMP phosphodiesterase class II)